MPEGFERIEHLIVVTMENRSFDHYLGALSLPPENRSDIDGHTLPPRSNPDQDGNPVTVWNMDGTYLGYGDSPHGWEPSHASYNSGANDGFVRSYQQAFPTDPDGSSPPRIPMGYYTRATLPVLYSLADNFTVCDHWFGSVLSSTWPNQKYLHSGRRDDDNDTQTLPPFPGFKTTPLYNVLEDTRDPNGQKLTWKCYFSDLPFMAFWYTFSAYHALHNFAAIASFVDDCREDRLPTVSIINPPYSLADDHPSHDVRLGQKFIGLVVDALTHSESWETSALVILYDENGGFYDHIPPPESFEAQAGETPLDTPLGFRVPTIVLSPYARRRYVSKVNYDHTSFMRSIHDRWNVPLDPQTFGNRWPYAPSIWDDCFDFTQDPLPMGSYIQPPDPLKSLDWSTGIQELVTNPVGGIEAFLERVFILPGLKALDRRAQLFDSLTAMEQSVGNLKRAIG